MADYTTLTTLKQRLGIADTADDTTLSALITAASRAIDRWCKRADGGFVGTAETRVFDVAPTIAGARHFMAGSALGGGTVVVGIPATYVMLLDIDPLLSVTSVATDGNADGVYETVWAATDYELLPANAALDGQPYRQIRTSEATQQQFPIGQKRMQIVGTWGEATATPPVIQEAAILTAIRWYKRKDSPFGVVGSPEIGLAHIPLLDPDVRGMLQDAGYTANWVFA